MTNKLLDPRFDAFCRWAATWPIARTRAGLPYTQKEFAQSIEVTEQTLCNWKKRPEYQQLVQSYIDEYAAAARPLIIGALIETASLVGREGYQDRKLYFQMQEGLDPATAEQKRLEMERADLIAIRQMSPLQLREAGLAELRKEHPEKSRSELEDIWNQKLDESHERRNAQLDEGDDIKKWRGMFKKYENRPR